MIENVHGEVYSLLIDTFIKNPKRGPCSAIKEGLYFGNSNCVIVYPADDFINFNIFFS